MSKNKIMTYLVGFLLVLALYVLFAQGTTAMYLYINATKGEVSVKDVNYYLPPFSSAGAIPEKEFYGRIADSNSNETTTLPVYKLKENIYYLFYDPKEKNIEITVCNDSECKSIIGSTMYAGESSD